MNWKLDLSEVDVNDLSLASISRWPKLVKALLVLILAVIAMALSYFLLIEAQISQLNAARAEEQKLKQTYRIKYAAAANLKLYQQQMNDMEQLFDVKNKEVHQVKSIGFRKNS